ncbi:unnamed protein product [Caenorhabditis bovis]|uniref:Uncharacterized protein n=1 Tax=Caenorhabditis bovis TaxID=2654633 RepID=A0A8S1FAK2_9PELO|nr:unnamed protein product [Caenorhabditis bovis]
MLSIILAALICFIQFAFSDYCGTNAFAIGFEVRHSGMVGLICSKPNCMDKKFLECPERPEFRRGCPGPNELVGAIEKTVDDELQMMCCEFENLGKNSKIRYAQVRLRRGEFYEGEEIENKDGDVTKFDFIKDINVYRDNFGIPYYNLTVYTLDCSNFFDEKPAWFQRSQWPYFTFHKN